MCLKGKLTALSHQLLRQPQSSVCAHDAERGDMAVLDSIGGVFFHLGKDVAYDLGSIVGCLFRARDLEKKDELVGFRHIDWVDSRSRTSTAT